MAIFGHRGWCPIACSQELLVLTYILKSGSLALAFLLSSGSIQPLIAQHHGGGHHSGGGGSMHHGGGGGGSIHHGGGGYGGSSFGGATHHHHSGSVGGIYIGGGGIGLSYGSGLGYGGYGGYGGYNSLRYSSGYGYAPYNSYPSYGGYSNYGSSVYVTPQYVNPAPTIIYQSPSVQPSIQSRRIIESSPQNLEQRTSLPGVTQGGRTHIAELADAVADRTNQLCIALHGSYLGNPQFNEVYRDVYSLITRSKQLASQNASGDLQAMLTELSDMNAILAQATPVIESWKARNGGSASATSHLSSVESALKLLSIDAGWDASLGRGQPPAPTQTSAPLEVAPTPESLPSEAGPTPLDPVPAP